jgi:hypothetical protein
VASELLLSCLAQPVQLQEQSASKLKFRTFIRKVVCSNLRRDIEFPEGGTSCSYSVNPSKLWNITVNQVPQTSLHIFPIHYSLTSSHPLVQSLTDRVVDFHSLKDPDSIPRYDVQMRSEAPMLPELTSTEGW